MIVVFVYLSDELGLYRPWTFAMDVVRESWGGLLKAFPVDGDARSVTDVVVFDDGPGDLVADIGSADGADGAYDL